MVVTIKGKAVANFLRRTIYECMSRQTYLKAQKTELDLIKNSDDKSTQTNIKTVNYTDIQNFSDRKVFRKIM